MKFILFVEGYTEQKALADFLKRWLDAKLPQRVGIKVVRFEGCAELWRDTPQKAGLYLNGPDKADILGVISLLDLYGPNFYPPDKKTAQERYAWGKSMMEAKVGLPKFRQFFAVHETEAWLLSNPEIFPAAVRKTLTGKTAQPESINFELPPAKLLQKTYRDRVNRTYKKITDGKLLFDKLDPAHAYEKCPRLQEMLDEMLKMANDT